MTQNLELIEHGLKCDNEGCDWTDTTVKFSDYKEWINKECPKCGENVLTLDDYVNSVAVREMAEMINSLSSEELESISNNLGASSLDLGLKDRDDVIISINTHKKISIESIKITKNMIENQTFGQAIEALKEGKRVAREGWNGKNMFVFQRPEDQLEVGFIIEKVKSLPQSVKDFFKAQDEKEIPQEQGLTKIKFSSYFCMYAADGSIVNGWLASQTDMQANDWCILD